MDVRVDEAGEEGRFPQVRPLRSVAGLARDRVARSHRQHALAGQQNGPVPERGGGHGQHVAGGNDPRQPWNSLKGGGL